MDCLIKLSTKYVIVKALFFCSLFYICTNLWAPQALANEQDNINALYQKMPKLDDDFQVISNVFFIEYLKNKKIENWTNLDSVPVDVEVMPSLDSATLIAQVKKNISTVCQHYTQDGFSSILQLLYRSNETATLRTLSDCINKSGDSVAKTENYFLLAKYYYVRNNWQGVLAALSKLNARDLKITDGHYTDLLKGYVLQAQKKHRKAVDIYKRIPSSSPYYMHAKLNEGLAYLRQGWWTEAHQEFKLAIKNVKSKQHEDFKNRLLVVLGYSQLDNEFYRDARDTLRQVTLVSSYTNKALMGLGLAAAYQEDYTGAINAFNRLASHKENDLSVDESYLLVPNTYEELGDLNKAADSYIKAIEHYKRRLASLHLAKADLSNRVNIHAPTLLETLDSRADELYGAKNLIPDYIVKNYHMLLAMKTLSKNTFSKSNKVVKKLDALESQYDQALKSLVLNNISLREAILTSYLSQAKYGVAKLYDQP